MGALATSAARARPPQQQAAAAPEWTEDIETSAIRLARLAGVDVEARLKLLALGRQASLGAMSSALVHELASSVQALDLSLSDVDDFVRRTATDAPGVIESLDAVRDAGARVESLFRALRTFVQTGHPNRRPCQARDLVEASVLLCRGYLRSRARLVVNNPPDVLVTVEETLIVQALVNLLRNAGEASPSGGSISVDTWAEGDWLEISVCDDGPGVAPDLEARLFQPFFSTHGDRTGLGLAFAAEALRQQGGRVRYQRHPGRGARFSLFLPIPNA